MVSTRVISAEKAYHKKILVSESTYSSLEPVILTAKSDSRHGKYMGYRLMFRYYQQGCQCLSEQSDEWCLMRGFSVIFQSYRIIFIDEVFSRIHHKFD
jgi:hypothetical protein